MSCLVRGHSNACREKRTAWRFRRIQHALREEDANHCLHRIGVRACAKPAAPPEPALERRQTGEFLWRHMKSGILSQLVRDGQY
jgi:hypothetical protein